MSKIYDALVRAQQERTLDRLTRSGNAAEQPMEAAIRSVDEEKDSERIFQRLWMHESASQETDGRPESLAPRIQDLQEVRRVPWVPQLGRLPALAQGGPNVEHFRRLRSRLFEFRDVNPNLKSILISSGMPEDGKSFVAANLAICLARYKASRVLLIDGDMRRSALDRLLGCPREPGLTAYLSGQAELLDVLQRPASSAPTASLAHGLSSLTFIPGGNEGDKAADLSGNPRFKELMEAVSPHFDWVIVDSSPVNLVTDAVNLAHACDGVVLIARAGTTKYQAAQRALHELTAANVLGVVLNAAEDIPLPDYYYGYDDRDAQKE